MKQIKQDLQMLCQAAGAAGLQQVSQVAADMLRPLVDEVSIDKMGNVIGLRRCDRSDAPTLMLEAHMDEIGFMVTHIDDDGFVYVAAAGGIDNRVLTAQKVQIHGKENVYTGVFCSTPPHLAGKDGELPEIAKRGIDLGLTGEQAKADIPLGSRVTFAPSFAEMNETLVCAKALDDRAGMAAILHCLRKIDKAPCHIAVAFCVQEELGCRGSGPAVYGINPNAALVTDVSFALTPDADPYKCGKLGEGVMIGVSPILDRAMSDRLFDLAKTENIPFQTEVMGGSTGTDADRISTSLCGVPCALLSIPQRYMHTPIEVVDVRDVAAVGELMAVYIRKGGVQ